MKKQKEIFFSFSFCVILLCFLYWFSSFPFVFNNKEAKENEYTEKLYTFWAYNENNLLFFASFSFPPCAPFTSSDHLHGTHQSLIWCHRLVLILSAAGLMLPFLLLLVLLLMCVHSYTVYAPICTNDVLYQGEFLFYFIFSNPINVEQKKL